MTDKNSITRIASEYGGRLRVKSALNPVLWLCGLVVSPAVITMGLSGNSPWVLIILVVAIIGVALFGFIFLLIVDRDKLQSEEYQLRKQTLELIEEKGNIEAIDARLVDVISDPDAPPRIARSESKGAKK